MAIPHEPAALITHFARVTDARRFMKELRRAGFGGREVGMVMPRRELIVKQTLIGAGLGALAGLILGVAAGAYLTGTVPGVNPLVEINRWLGIALTSGAGAVIGLLPGAMVAMLVPPEDSGESPPDLAAVERTLVVVEAHDPARQEEAFEILAHFKPST